VVSENPFKAVPASILRVKKQLHAAADYAAGGIIAFSVIDYMSVEAGSAGLKLLDDYQKYKRGCQ
jgi:hypothetical protein